MDKIILPGLPAVSDGLFHLWNVRSYSAFRFWLKKNREKRKIVKTP